MNSLQRFTNIHEQLTNTHLHITWWHKFNSVHKPIAWWFIMQASYCSLVHELLCQLRCNYYVVHKLFHESLLTKLLMTPIDNISIYCYT